MPKDDVAQQVAPLKDLLYSAGNRIKIAEILLEFGEDELLPTVLEDLFYGCQLILEHCVKP